MLLTRRYLGLVLSSAATAPAFSQSASPPPAPVFIYAGAPGQLTQDRDARGGNPFASALVDVLHQDQLKLEQFCAQLSVGNARYSGGWHRMQMPRVLPDPGARMDAAAGRRMALVLINADYSRTPGIYSLPGAAVDAQRVPEALERAGFETMRVLDAGADAARAALAEFAAASAGADMALVYVGGHGVQKGRTVYAVMGDYPEPQSSRHLATHALPLGEIGRAARASTLNLVLYASCRDDPFVRN
jgi:hypothetical protein